MLIDYYYCVQIRSTAIDFWADLKMFKNNFSQIMQRRCEQGMYPPHVEMTVTLKSSDAIFKLPIKFTGHDRDDDLDMELTLPLCKP